MALLKEIRDTNGVIGVYHRIASVNKNYNKLFVEMESYADDTYRKKEKERLELSEQVSDLITRLSVVTGTIQNEETEKEAEKINMQLAYYNELCAVKQFFAFKTSVMLSYTDGDDISFEAIYEKLVGSDTVFAGAEEIK